MRGSKVALVDYMRKNSGITSKEAFEEFGITRLSARIMELRQMGYDIVTLMMDGKTRFGESCRYAKYVLKGEPKNG